MTNLEAMKFAMACAAEALTVAHRMDETARLAREELESVAWCDVTSPAHDDELARRYDQASHDLAEALELRERATRIYTAFRGRIVDMIDEAISAAAD